VCGLYALALSYNAARNQLRRDGTPEISEVTIKQWLGWLNGEEYSIALDTFIETHSVYSVMDDEGKDTMRRRLSASSWLSQEHMSILLE
jgi:hypothetical protein